MSNILDLVNLPPDLKNLNLTQMNELAGEIRQFMLNSIARCGGHLAANLGVVELTIALHYVFDCPQDKIIWDVGHQSYVHKILTGRKDRMNTLRQFKGMSGFPKCDESDYDAFGTGHSSTSISAALGMAIARDLKQEKNSVIAVIGDGALTGGMSFEALNHAGHEGRDITVILNDNAMSISRNVGAMAAYLNRLRTDPSYHRTKEEIESRLKKIPGIGLNLARVAIKFKDLVKYLIVPGILFEELGFTYIGPVNGHDMEQLVTVLKNVRKMKGPLLVHVITHKGRGYEPAVQYPDLYHGIGPFNLKTGKPLKKGGKTFTEIFSEFMLKKGNEDPNLVAITAAMTSGTGLSDFAVQFPERFFDVGICEQHAVTMAAGMAKSGLKPVVAIYSTFLQRAYDQLVHDIALQNLPVIFAVDRAGLVGEDGPTHHGVFDLSYLRGIPNFTIMAPADGQDFKVMLEEAFKINGPVAIRYPRGTADDLMVQVCPDTGKAQLIKQGNDITILAIGRTVALASELSSLLEGQGLTINLVNMRFLKPLDEDLLLRLADKCPRIVTLEDNILIGGFGTAVLELLNDNKITADVLRIGIPDQFVEQGEVNKLFEQLNLTVDSIVANIYERWPEFNINTAWELRKIGES